MVLPKFFCATRRFGAAHSYTIAFFLGWCKMTKGLFVLREMADFASGAFENTAVDGGGIQLGRMGAGRLSEGSYTSPPYKPGAFRKLIPSWNADTPQGTSVEMQVRVLVKGKWSQWFSFGIWCPFQDRTSPEARSDELAAVDAEYLTVLGQGAESAQMRVHLRAAEEHLTPTVRLMALSVQLEESGEAADHAGNRELELPAYSCLVRDPAIASRMGGATSLAMLMNRWGADVLPEEVARAVYDVGAGKYENLAFLSAVGGTYGYECYAGYGGLDILREEVWMGCGVAAKVRYRAPALSSEEKGGKALEKPDKNSAPVLPGATVDSAGHLVVLCGFAVRDGEEWVLMHDPMAPSNEATRREVRLDLFKEMYTGIYLALHRGPRKPGSQKWQRKLVGISLADGEIRLFDGKKVLIPGPFTQEELPRSTLCYVLSSPVAYPSAAQRQFYYPTPDENGVLKFDENSAVGHRMTFYRIGPHGYTWVAEKKIAGEKPPIAESRKEKNDDPGRSDQSETEHPEV